MERAEYEWYINLVRDRHSVYALTFEQAEQVYRYEEERNNTYSEKYIFSIWEEFEFERYVYQQILDENQLITYEEEYLRKIISIEQGIRKTDAVRQDDNAYAQDRLDYYVNVFIPEFKSKLSPSSMVLFRHDLHKVDFLKKEYARFLGEAKRGILVEHFREHRTFAPNLLRNNLLQHDCKYLMPDYLSFKRQFDEPQKVVDQYLRRKVHVSEDLSKFLGEKFEMLKAFNKSNLDKHYTDRGDWRYWSPKVDPEEEIKDQVMTLLLFDPEAYGWTGPKMF